MYDNCLLLQSLPGAT